MIPRSLNVLGSLRLRLALGVLAGCAAAGCAMHGGKSPEPVAKRSPPHTGEFRDQFDLLQSIKQGTFAKRVGLDHALPPSPQLTIPFPGGTAVPKDELPEIRDLAGRLKAAPGLAVDLEGCSDPSGSAALNRKVSKARAESVAAALRQRGVDESQIRNVVGLGEACGVPERAVHIEIVSKEVSKQGGGSRSPA